MIKYITVNNIHDYDLWDSIVANIKDEFKYGGAIFDTGWNDHIYMCKE